ncbi:hypothetical protein [Embleya sp. MST-111070]|uniref:hypothetical protein n=1 Tax=Embleya sp. MST-111070 TaxID=3398231 RepID=UPI003F73A9F9
MSKPSVPAVQPSGGLLDDDESRVAAARRQVTRLAAALVLEPLDRDLHEALRAFLDNDSEPALQSWDALLSRTPEELRARIHALLTARGDRRSAS